MDLGAVALPLFGYDLPPLQCLRTPLMASGMIPAPKCSCGGLFLNKPRFHPRGRRLHDQSLAFRAGHRLNIIFRHNPAARNMASPQASYATTRPTFITQYAETRAERRRRKAERERVALSGVTA